MKERLRFSVDTLNFVYITLDSVDYFLNRTNGQPDRSIHHSFINEYS